MDVIACLMPDGSTAVVHPGKGFTAADVIDDIPEVAVAHSVIDTSALPGDRIFRSAWTVAGGVVSEDLARSIEIAHKRRRIKRDEDFKPHDDVIAKAIPGADAVAAEAAREAIRQADTARQVEIDGAATTDALRAILTRDGL